MRMLSGAILILAAEQAFAHAHMAEFPNQVFVNEVLYPTSMVFSAFGIGFLIWGAITERKPSE